MIASRPGRSRLTVVGTATVLLITSSGAARAQEPAGQASPPQSRSDTVEVVDRIVAVVGDTAILYTEILESLLQIKAEGADIPDPGTAAFDTVARESTRQLVDQLVLLQKAKQSDLQVPPEMLDGETDRRFQEIRNGFPNATAFQEAVQSSGRTLVQYRQFLRSQVRAQILIDQFVRQSRESMPPVVVTEEEIVSWYNANLEGQTWFMDTTNSVVDQDNGGYIKAGSPFAGGERFGKRRIAAIATSKKFLTASKTTRDETTDSNSR